MLVSLSLDACKKWFSNHPPYLQYLSHEQFLTHLFRTIQSCMLDSCRMGGFCVSVIGVGMHGRPLCRHLCPRAVGPTFTASPDLTARRPAQPNIYPARPLRQSRIGCPWAAPHVRAAPRGRPAPQHVTWHVRHVCAMPCCDALLAEVAAQARHR